MVLKDSERAALAKDWGIDRKESEDWPESLEKLFSSVEELGIEPYPFLKDQAGAPDQKSRHAVADRSKFEQRIRERTRDLARTARSLREQMYDKSETDWRVGLESILFQHFKDDVIW
ncbi:hypothetical protein NQ176_g7023 [Zarea fungicola]|uniref:Uncharacterized protein n=1 Tax=Zarea fungicola TaxID=93591 RepID=A0ACC1N077_9HYPO|nr:hypothetical protein NQ176_g7023 [Lecanicillium fungicola]